MNNSVNIQQLALNLGLSILEYNLIVDKLGREPNEFETYLFFLLNGLNIVVTSIQNII